MAATKRRKVADCDDVAFTLLSEVASNPFRGWEKNLILIIDSYLQSNTTNSMHYYGQESYFEFHTIRQQMHHMYVICGLSHEMLRGVYSSCVHGDLSVLKLMLAHVVHTDENMSRACYFASYFGHASIVKYLIQEHKSPTSTTQAWASDICEGHSMLVSAFHGHLDVVKVLLPVDQSKAYEAFHEACCEGHVEIAKYLLSNSSPEHDLHEEINENQERNNHTLDIVTRKGHLNAVKYLVSLGVDIAADQQCALHTASSYGHLDIVKYMVEMKCDVNDGRYNPFISACSEGHLEVAKYLRSVGSDISIMGNLVFMSAAERGDLEMVEFLLKCAKEDTGETRDLLNSFEHAAINAALENGHTEVFQYLSDQY